MSIPPRFHSQKRLSCSTSTQSRIGRFVRGGTAILLLAAITGCGGDDGGSEVVVHPLTGKSYIVDLADGVAYWSKPQGAMELSRYVPKFVFSFGEATGNSVSTTVGTADVGGQDACGPTLQATATAAAPSFSLGPVLLPVQLDHPDQAITVNTKIEQLTFDNIIPEGATSASGRMTALVNVGDVYPLFTQLNFGNPPDDPASVCTSIEGQGGECVPCPSGGQYCLEVQADYLTATVWSGTVQATPESVWTAGCPTTH